MYVCKLVRYDSLLSAFRSSEHVLQNGTTIEIRGWGKHLYYAFILYPIFNLITDAAEPEAGQRGLSHRFQNQLVQIWTQKE